MKKLSSYFLRQKNIKNSYLSLVMAASMLSTPLFALGNCDDKVFSNLSANRGTTIAQLLEQLSSRCSFSISIKDSTAENIVSSKSLNTINLKDFTLNDVFEFLLTENNLDYEYQNNILRISSYTTKTFKVDYITAVRSAETTFVLGNGGSSSSATSSMSGGQQGIPNTSSSVGSTFKANDSNSKFWDTIKNDLNAILNPDFATIENTVELKREAQTRNGGDVAEQELTATQNRSTQLRSNSLIINPQAGLITITANKAKLKLAEEYINAVLDRLHKQVLIDVQILEVTMSNEKKTGIDWEQIYSLQNMNVAYGVDLGKNFAHNKVGNSDTSNSFTDTSTNNVTKDVTNAQTNDDSTTTTKTGAIKTDVTDIVDTTDTVNPANTGTVTTNTIKDSKANSQTNQTINNIINSATNNLENVTTNNTTNKTNNLSFNDSITNSFTRNGTLTLKGGIQINDIIKFLAKQGSVKSVSNPKILTLNNQPALITSGDVIFYPKVSGGTSATATTGATNPTVDTVSLPVGVTLDITPEIMDEENVLLKINPTSSSCKANGCPLQQVLVGGVYYNIAPNIAQKQLSSVVKAKDGDRIILGGLIQEVSNGNTTKVPGVGDIPIAGYLFKQDYDTKELRELVIIITPHIVKKEKTLSLKELGYKSDLDK